jgi:hypothetical protein
LRPGTSRQGLRQVTARALLSAGPARPERRALRRGGTGLEPKLPIWNYSSR